MKNIRKIFVITLVLFLSILVSCKKNPKLEEVTFNNMVTSMIKGDEFVINHSNQEGVTATFTSSNSNVAVVEGNKVTAVGIGSFTLTGTFKLGKESKSYEFVIEVKGKEYGINYELNDGVLPEGYVDKYVEGVGVVLPIPTKEGYNFLGWSLEDGSTNFITEISSTQEGEVTVYA